MKKIAIVLLFLSGGIAHSQIEIVLSIDSLHRMLNVTYINDDEWVKDNLYFPKILTKYNCYPKSSTDGLIYYGPDKKCGHAEYSFSRVGHYCVVITPSEMLVKAKGGFLYKNYYDDGSPSIAGAINKLYREEKEVDSCRHIYGVLFDSAMALTPEDVQGQYKNDFVFLKHGESYTESFSIAAFYKTGSSFSFYVSGSWRVKEDGSIIPHDFCHYEDVMRLLPPNVGDYKLYRRKIDSNHVEFIQ